MATPVDYFDHLYCTEDLHQFCSTVHRAEETSEDLEDHGLCKKTFDGKCIYHVKVLHLDEGNSFRDNQYDGCRNLERLITYPGLNKIKTEVCDLCLDPIPEKDYSSPLRDLHGAHRRCAERLTDEQFRQWMNTRRW